MLKRLNASLIALVIVLLALLAVGSALGDAGQSPPSQKATGGSTPSGVVSFKDIEFGTGITECPQAGISTEPEPLDRRVKDEAEKRSERGDDRRTNTEYSCFPQNETAIDVNPTNRRNIVAGQNDYRLGWATSGLDASVNNGREWYDLLAPFPSLPNGDNLDGGGDPGVVFDRSGVVYYSDINFNRTDDTNGIWVRRSTNGGFTWSRPCVPINVGTPTDDQAVCGGVGDPRRPGDGTVVFQFDNNTAADFSVTFHDKVYIAAGPRPAGVTPVCFAPETKTPIPAGSPDCPESIIGVDRLYVTWTAFNNPTGVPLATESATIELSYSDDMARSWSPRKTISGSAPFCLGLTAPTACDNNQFSVPTVHPKTGLLGVAFENFNTPDENQYLFVRSSNGGATVQGPFFVTPIYDVNFPRAGGAGGRPDCTARGQQAGRIVYTNSCFRSNAGGNVVVDRREGDFADDFYLVMSDNRNGTRASSNSDVFLFKSLNGGSTWIGPTRVNNDASTPPANRDCDRPGQPACPAGVHTGNDQWWPWTDINERGDLVVTFKDRRLDTDATAHEWPTSRQRPGNYLVWTWGANCEVGASNAATCMAPGAAVIPQPTAPINPGSGPQPGQGPSFLGPLENFGVSDVPSNFDYSFRAGIFAGDYDVVAVEDDRAYAHFTDARNGRSSRDQAGRNPACEQADVFFESWGSRGRASGQNGADESDSLFLVTPCPDDIKDKGRKSGDDD